MTLTEFLLARIAEDEAVVDRDCKGSDCYVCPNHEGLDTIRVLAECEAKRRIVEELERDHDRHSRESYWMVIRHLALPYADHPDYRAEWRP